MTTYYAILWLLAVAVYFLPTWIVRFRQQPNEWSFWLWNFLFGWCPPVWLLLLWLATKERRPEVLLVQQQQAEADWRQAEAEIEAEELAAITEHQRWSDAERRMFQNLNR